MFRATTKEILLTELSNRKPEEIRLSFAIGWMRAIEGEKEPIGGNRTGSGT